MEKPDFTKPKTITSTVLLGALVLAIILSLLVGCSTTKIPVKDHKDCCKNKEI
jgi:hypothetical protein